MVERTDSKRLSDVRSGLCPIGRIAGALLLIPGIFTRLVAFYTLPMMLGAAQFWLVRKGFYFTRGGAELPLVWAVLLAIQAVAGDGNWALVSTPAWPRPRG